ncbi:hypothetical protein BKA70DRAFT_1438678 [Coprinopsis sp. MPI-PUGE-AT-0042]|nr:hypothetical protein BKA70DRAFT_1438678 [Coprinopsis sp. MPI-PUGE-AT-0042]
MRVFKGVPMELLQEPRERGRRSRILWVVLNPKSSFMIDDRIDDHGCLGRKDYEDNIDLVIDNVSLYNKQGETDSRATIELRTTSRSILETLVHLATYPIRPCLPIRKANHLQPLHYLSLESRNQVNNQPFREVRFLKPLTSLGMWIIAARSNFPILDGSCLLIIAVVGIHLLLTRAFYHAKGASEDEIRFVRAFNCQYSYIWEQTLETSAPEEPESMLTEENEEEDKMMQVDAANTRSLPRWSMVAPTTKPAVVRVGFAH